MRRTGSLRIAAGAIAAVTVLGLLAPKSDRTLRSAPKPVPETNIMTTPQRREYDRSNLVADLGRAGFKLGDQAFIRIFKRERRLEVWLAQDSGRFERFRSYDICNFSGVLGPKLKEGDLQAPEGFYRVGLRQLNPNSRHHLAFNLGFPNEFDRAHERTGSVLMVHGGCTSLGCYAMTDEKIDEIYAMVEAALEAGQAAVDVHAFPFELTQTAMTQMQGDRWAGFWANLKQGHDLFEANRVPPRVGTCNGEYRFGTDVADPDCTEIGYWRA